MPAEGLLERARARYRLLLRQLQEEALQDEETPRGGWQELVAQRLGVSQTLVSKTVLGQRQPSLPTIDEACARLSIPPDFFFSPDFDEPHYRDHQGRRSADAGEIPDEDVPFWATFRAQYDRFDELDASDIATMKSFRFKGRRGLRVRAWTDWAVLADWVLNRKPSARFEESE